ncbi:MAG: carbohydrate porin [Candidatus Eisenbacteria bacterium]
MWGKSAFEGPDHAFLISEAGWRRAGDGGASRLALGLWHHTGQIPTFAGETLDGTAGFYALAERSQVTDRGTVGVYLQLGTADGAVSEVDRHLGAGVTWTGALAARPEDTLGFEV